MPEKDRQDSSNHCKCFVDGEGFCLRDLISVYVCLSVALVVTAIVLPKH